MSRENVEIVLRALNAAVRRPKPDVATMNALFLPDHVLVGDLQRNLAEEPIEGGEGYRAMLQATDVMSWETAIESAVDVGPQTVLAVGMTAFTGGASGVRQERRMWVVVTLADRKLARTEVFFDPAQALEAVGLTE